MRRWVLLLAVALSGCNAILGIKSVEQANPDGPIACKVSPSFELLQAADGAQGASLDTSNGQFLFLLALNVDELTDFFGLILRPGQGGLPSPIVEGTYQIGGADTKLESCGLCAFLATDFHGTFDGDDFYLASDGEVELVNVHGRFVVNLRNVHFRHVRLGLTTEDVDDGCGSEIQQVSINMSLSRPDAGMPDAARPDSAVVQPPDAGPPDAAPPDGPPIEQPDAGPLVTVTGTAIDTYVADQGESNVPIDLSGESVQALVPNGGGFTVIDGTGKPDGTFTIPGVPVGSRYVRVGQTYLVTGATQLDFGRNRRGRSDPVEVPSESAYFSVNLSNVESAKDGDVFEVSASNLDLFFNVPTTIGQTSFVDSMWTTALIENRDQVYISQLSGRTSGTGQGYHALSRIYTPPRFATMEGMTTTLAPAAFANVPPMTTVALDWRTTAFQAARPTVNPQAVYDQDGLFVTVVSGRPKVPDPFGTPDLFISQRSDTTDANFGNVSFGDPYPSAWERWVIAETQFHVRYTAPLATQGIDAQVFLSRVEPLAGIGGQQIRPVVSPVRFPKINNNDAFTVQNGVGQTPLISFAGPVTGTPNLFWVGLWDLKRDDSDGSSFFDFVAEIYTTERSVRVPPGLLQPGHTYFADITAYVVPNGDPTRAPNKRGLPQAYADMVTATFTP